MTKRFNLLSLSAACGAVLAVTTVYALANAPKAVPDTAHAAVSKTVSAFSKTFSPTSNKSDGDGEENDEKDAPNPTSAKVTPAQATAAALAAHPGGKVTDTPELENENGVAVYGLDITVADGKKYDVKVDANTGKVLTSEADNDGEQNDGPDSK